MLYSNFVMVERNEGASSRYFVIYSREPHFCIEVDPGYNPFGKMGNGFIKSIRVKNSWTGDYHRCISLAKEAEQFFRQSFQEEALRR